MDMWFFPFFMLGLMWFVASGYDNAKNRAQTKEFINLMLEENRRMQDRLLKILERIEQAKSSPQPLTQGDLNG